MDFLLPIPEIHVSSMKSDLNRREREQQIHSGNVSGSGHANGGRREHVARTRPRCTLKTLSVRPRKERESGRRDERTTDSSEEEDNGGGRERER